MPTQPLLQITPGPPRLVTRGPAGENRWGFHQFPDMWRAPGGEIYIAVHVGADSNIGEHQASPYFVSRDEGQTWQRCSADAVDFSPIPIRFSDGSEVAFGQSVFVYHQHNQFGVQPWQWWLASDLGIKPVTPPLRDAYDNNDWVAYRFADLPPDRRTFPAAWRAGAGEPWQHGSSTLDAPDLHLMSLARADWWDERQQRMSVDMEQHQIHRPWPHFGQIVRMPDDTLLWAKASMHPRVAEIGRPYYCVLLLASTDRGHSWHQRGMVVDDTALATDGYSCEEHSFQLMPNGDLFCVMRTEMGDQPASSRHLAAVRSTDGGRTWCAPFTLAPFSVTPMLMVLPNGMAAVAYGRPGVYVKASADSGRTWSEPLSVVGPPEAELLKDRWWAVRYDHRSDNKISCGNLGEVASGPDRFLLAYSDFRHRTEAGETCKAVLVREFTVRPTLTESRAPSPSRSQSRG